MTVALAFGGRRYNDMPTVDKALTELNPSIVVQGGCVQRRGGVIRDDISADRLARLWAEKNGVWCVEVPALWSAHGRAAGIRRNEWMLHVASHLTTLNPDPMKLVGVCFPGGNGTLNMLSLLRRAGVEVLFPAGPPP